MDTASISAPHASSTKPHRGAHRRWGRTALRWIGGVSVFALLAATGVGVASAFADLAREDALAGAYQQASADAARAAGGNPGPDWATLLEAPSGRRSLALWFDAMQSQWPAACAARMAEISQSSALCLPDSGFLQAMVEARLGPESFDRLAQNAAATAQERAMPEGIGDPDRLVDAYAVTAIDSEAVASQQIDPEPMTALAAQAADALRAEADEGALESFQGAYEPEPFPVLMDDAPAVVAPESKGSPALDEPQPLPQTPEELIAPITAGPSFDPDEPIAADPSAIVGEPVLDGATLALVSP